MMNIWRGSSDANNVHRTTDCHYSSIGWAFHRHQQDRSGVLQKKKNVSWFLRLLFMLIFLRWSKQSSQYCSRMTVHFFSLIIYDLLRRRKIERATLHFFLCLTSIRVKISDSAPSYTIANDGQGKVMQSPCIRQAIQHKISTLALKIGLQMHRKHAETFHVTDDKVRFCLWSPRVFGTWKFDR